MGPIHAALYGVVKVQQRHTMPQLPRTLAFVSMLRGSRGKWTKATHILPAASATTAGATTAAAAAAAASPTPRCRTPTGAPRPVLHSHGAY